MVDTSVDFYVVDNMVQHNDTEQLHKVYYLNLTIDLDNFYEVRSDNAHSFYIYVKDKLDYFQVNSVELVIKIVSNAYDDIYVNIIVPIYKENHKVIYKNIVKIKNKIRIFVIINDDIYNVKDNNNTIGYSSTNHNHTENYVIHNELNIIIHIFRSI